MPRSPPRHWLVIDIPNERVSTRLSVLRCLSVDACVPVTRFSRQQKHESPWSSMRIVSFVGRHFPNADWFGHLAIWFIIELF